VKLASPITLCGSLSLHPVGLGAAMHNAAYAALGMAWTYVPFAIERDELLAALAGMRALGIRGFGVSMPFKLDVLPLLDRIDPLAAKIGAVNTIVNDAGTLVGHNTDAVGASRALEEAIGPLAGKRCLVLGAGGAARAVAFGLEVRGARVTISSRDDARAELLAREVGVPVLPWVQAQKLDGEIDVVVNASSAGMDQGHGPSPSPIEPHAISARVTVMDIVYRPLETDLYREAQDRGARAVRGDRMLLFQAAAQHELYTGAPAPLAAMEKALANA
jgi:shikimate dehydrogenase